MHALKEIFKSDASVLAASLDHGLRELLADADLLEESQHAVDVWLLSSRSVRVENLAAVAGSYSRMPLS